MSHNFHIPSGASVPAITGEYAYYVPSLMGTSGMIHYWNISTPDKHSAFCHFLPQNWAFLMVFLQ